MNILDGVLLFYFPLNYGSEPLYNYVVAVNMALAGENLFALRYVNVVFGIFTIAIAYLWTSWAFNRRTALVTALLVAISFWPLATSRQALRVGMLPFLTTTAVVFFWQLYRWAENKLQIETFPWKSRWWAVAGFAFAVAATLHTYLAARVLWLMYPIFLAYLAIGHKVTFRRLWKPVAIGLLGAGLLVIPMFAYLEAHPEADTRLEMLDGPLQNLIQGDLLPVIRNGGEAFLAFFWQGLGDHFLAYNIPGRPVLHLVTAIFFIIGLLSTLWRWRRPEYAFVLIWFIVGILPSLITGPEANTTRNMGALTPTYLLPALGFMTVTQLITTRWIRFARPVASGVLVVWLLLVMISTINDYFIRWSQSPDVRAAYQHTLTQALAYLEELPEDERMIISSIFPGPAHDPSIARVLLEDSDYDLRWVDARYALILPSGSPSNLIVPASTPLHPAFQALTTFIERINMRQDDLDPSLTLYDFKANNWPQLDEPVNFADAVTLQGARWLKPTYSPGDTAELLTVWRVNDPTKVGPLVPPAFETNVVMFTHILDESGTIVAQRDSLEAPSWDWETEDIVLQIHPIQIPTELPAGVYSAAIGIYDPTSGNRLPVIDDSGVIVGNQANVVPLRLNEQ